VHLAQDLLTIVYARALRKAVHANLFEFGLSPTNFLGFDRAGRNEPLTDELRPLGLLADYRDLLAWFVSLLRLQRR
jgi:hypothetical protein